MKTLLSVSYSESITFSSVIQCSDDGQIAICTNDGSFVLNVESALSKKDSECISTRIAAATKRVPYDVGISWAMLRDTFLVNPDGFNELNFDQTENPAGFSVTGFRSVRWSPIGCDEVGRCALVVVNADRRLSVWCRSGASANLAQWREVCDLTTSLIDHWSVSNYATLEGGQISSNEKLVSVYQRRIRAVTVADVAWRPNLVTSATGQTEAVLVALLRSGHLAVWKIGIPFNESSNSRLIGVINSSLSTPSCICWGAEDSRESCVMGSVEGCINEADLTQLLLEELSVSCVATEEVTMSDVYAIADRQRVRGLLWSKQDNILFATRAGHLDAYLGLHIGEIQKISIRLAKKLPLLGEIQWCDAMKVLVATEDRFFFVCQLNQNHVTGEMSFSSIEVSDIPVVPIKGLSQHRLLCGFTVTRGKSLLMTLDRPRQVFCVKSSSGAETFAIHQLMEGDEVAAKMLMNSPSDIPMEYILITKAGFLSDGLLPAALQRLVDERDQWHALSLKHKQILRILLLLRQTSILPASPYDFVAANIKAEVDAIQADVALLDTDIVTEHCRPALTTLVSNDHYVPVSEPDVRSAQLMCQLLSKSDSAADNSLVTAVNARLGLAFKSSLVELCPVCTKSVTFKWPSPDSCVNGHSFARCTQTLLLCSAVPIRHCTVCRSSVVARTVKGSAWFESLKSSKCTLCTNNVC